MVIQRVPCDILRLANSRNNIFILVNILLFHGHLYLIGQPAHVPLILNIFGLSWKLLDPIILLPLLGHLLLDQIVPSKLSQSFLLFLLMPNLLNEMTFTIKLDFFHLLSPLPCFIYLLEHFGLLHLKHSNSVFELHCILSHSLPVYLWQ